VNEIIQIVIEKDFDEKRRQNKVGKYYSEQGESLV